MGVPEEDLGWAKYDVALVGTKMCKYEHVPDGQ